MDDQSDDDNNQPPLQKDRNVYGYLVCYNDNDNSGRPYILTKPTTTFGRKPNNDIHLNNNTISTKEAFIIDLKSTNKTRIGHQLPTESHKNKSIKPNRECIIRSGDYVTFGDVHFIFYHEDDYTSAPVINTSNKKKKRIVLGDTQAFDDEETITNTLASEIDLKLSLSDDENNKNKNTERNLEDMIH